MSGFSEKQESILSYGLKSVNDLEASDHNSKRSYNGVLKLRSDSVYLATREGSRKIHIPGEARYTVRVDIRKLPVEYLFPDEDIYYSDIILTLNRDLKTLNAEEFGMESPLKTVKDRYSREEGETDEEFNKRPYSSYGEWAEVNHPGQTLKECKKALTIFGLFGLSGIYFSFCYRKLWFFLLAYLTSERTITLLTILSCKVCFLSSQSGQSESSRNASEKVK